MKLGILVNQDMRICINSNLTLPLHQALTVSAKRLCVENNLKNVSSDLLLWKIQWWFFRIQVRIKLYKPFVVSVSTLFNSGSGSPEVCFPIFVPIILKYPFSAYCTIDFRFQRGLHMLMLLILNTNHQPTVNKIW